MLELNKVLKFLDYFSIITVGSNKVPNHSWKEQQTEKLSKEVFTKHYKRKKAFVLHFRNLYNSNFSFHGLWGIIRKWTYQSGIFP